MPECTDRFFIPPPTPTSETRKDADENLLPVYLDEKGGRLLWSGDFPLPEIDSRVFVKMNNIGWSLVKGYYASAGYVGVMTLPINPPAWLCEQWLTEQDSISPEWAKQGIGYEFGSELSLAEPAKSSSLQDVVLTLQYCLETFEAACQCGKCDPCRQGRRDIRTAISIVEELDWPIDTVVGKQCCRFVLQRAGVKAEFDGLRTVIDFVRDFLPPSLVLHDSATRAEVAAMAARKNWTLVEKKGTTHAPQE
jgi:hypothetical protein